MSPGLPGLFGVRGPCSPTLGWWLLHDCWLHRRFLHAALGKTDLVDSQIDDQSPGEIGSATSVTNTPLPPGTNSTVLVHTPASTAVAARP